MHKYITPALLNAGWNIDTQILEEVSFTDGKIFVRGKLTARGKRKRADYILYYNSNPVAIIEVYLCFPGISIGHTVSDQFAAKTGKKKSHAVSDQFSIRNTIQRPESKGNPEKSYALRSQLSWTHYRLLLRVENDDARSYYMNEAADSGWSTRALERQINSFYYERILSSKNKKKTAAEAKKNTETLAIQPEDFIKDPFVLEFLNLPAGSAYLEKDIEAAIVSKLQQFLLELGKGFSFVARQKKISADDDHFYIDLVFYNYILKCFVLIDLKLGKLTHQDIGQMDLYVRWYEDNIKTGTDNPTIGIILCSQKNETIVKYSVLKESRQLFASKYKLYLPTEDELKAEVQEEIIQYNMQHRLKHSK